MAETKDTRALCKMLRERRNVQFYPLVASKYAPPGWPDRLFSHKLFTLCLVEFKAWDGILKPLQRRRQLELERICVCRFQADSVKGIYSLRIEDYDGNFSEWFDPLRLPEALAVWFNK